MFSGMRWESKGLCWAGSAWEEALPFQRSRVQNSSISQSRGKLGDPYGSPWGQQQGRGAPDAQRGIHEEVNRDAVTAEKMPMRNRGRWEGVRVGKGSQELYNAALDTSRFQCRAGDRDLQTKLQSDRCPGALELPVESSPSAVLGLRHSPTGTLGEDGSCLLYGRMGCIALTLDSETSQPRKDCQVLAGDERGLMPRDGRRTAAG